MRSRARLTRSRPRIIFRRSNSDNNTINSNTTSNRSASKMSTAIEPQMVSLSHEDQDAGPWPQIPSIFTSAPPLRDAWETETSRLQDATLDECLPFLKGEHDACNAHGIPHLDRQRHANFLHKQLGKLPAAFMSADPSRPWFFYWCLAGLALLGEDVSVYRERLIETARPMQNAAGGFAGGFGQTSHLATTYAIVLSLALVGGEDAYDVVDRRAMWKWLCSLKQPDGGFQLALGGEEDVRGAYCAAVIISLLNLPLDLSPDSPACAAGHSGLFTGLAEYVRRCQTYEGGVSAKPGVEAHGAYAFCALGCLAILDSPHRSIPRYLDVPLLISWLSSRQYAPEGGFSGRTNKLVDGCYSHWVGGCWPLIEASLNGPEDSTASSGHHPHPAARSSLFSRDALIRYIMYSDAYHTCYVLSGLSSAQHKWDLAAARAHESILEGDAWTVKPYMEGEQIFDEEDRICTTHPVYVIPQHKVQDIQRYFGSKEGF
ncbi:hypothetical protein G7046_g5219 [Stylonectria norvegica]|nr:hypothetical protein G7046_g5219 [Stylonectria norvegica]